MEEILKHLISLRGLTLKNLVNVIDILFVSYVIYRLLSLIRGSRTWRIVGGIVIFVLLLLLSSAFQLETLNWLLEKAALLAPVALVILLLPEMRHALEGIGRVKIWSSFAEERSIEASTIEEIIKAVTYMRSQKIGALIVIELGTPLDSIVSNGILIDAEVSAPLLESIFYEGNPLHDGAVVIRGDVLVGAACRLPLSESPRLDPTYHMRHRAALGVTEELHCLAVVVSEERGSISVAREGTLIHLESPGDLRDLLIAELRQPNAVGKKPRRRLFQSGPKEDHDRTT